MNNLLPTKDVRKFCGNVSEMTIWRWLNDDQLGFPKPVVIRNRRYWDAEELEAFRARVFQSGLARRAA